MSLRPAFSIETETRSQVVVIQLFSNRLAPSQSD